MCVSSRYPSSWLPVSKRHSTTLNSTEMTTCATLSSSPLERLAGTGGLCLYTRAQSSTASCVVIAQIYFHLLSIFKKVHVFVTEAPRLAKFIAICTSLNRCLSSSTACFLSQFYCTLHFSFFPVLLIYSLFLYHVLHLLLSLKILVNVSYEKNCFG